MSTRIVLERGRLLVHKPSRLVYVVWQVLPSGNVILECDDDGSLQNDDNPDGDGPPEEVLKEYEVWQPGMVVRDRIGRGVFCRAPNYWKARNGVPPAEIEQRVLATQPPWLPPSFSTDGLDRLDIKAEEE